MASSALFSPLTIRGVTFKNRVTVSPMCQYSAVEGVPNEWHVVTNGQRAIGGAGLVICEATGVVPEGRITPACTGIWNDAQVEGWKKVVSFVKNQGAAIGLQIGHAGRKASAARPWEGDRSLANEEGGWDTVAPSAIAFGGALTKVPKELTLEEIEKLEDAFAAAAGRADKAGFDVLELHGAHGYLINEFISPFSNKRTDKYGGSFENRTRFLVQIAQKVRKVWPESKPLFVRLSCTEWLDGGWTVEDSVELAKKLKVEGVDLFDCSSGFNTVEYKHIPFGPRFQVPLAEKIKKEANILTAAVGMITTGKEAEEIVKSGQADLVMFARQFLRDPNLAYHMAQELGLSSPNQQLSKAVGFWLKN